MIPESPRWLIAQGKYEDARAEVEKAALMNNVKLSSDIFYTEPNENKEYFTLYAIKDLFRSSQLKITLTMFICWPVVLLLYFGLTLSADKIKITENIFLSFILLSLIELPAYLIVPLCVHYLGRKHIFALCQIIPGLFFLQGQPFMLF